MEQQNILDTNLAIKYALNLINFSQILGTSILLVALGFVAFQVFRSSKGESKLLSWIAKNFGFLGISLGISQIVLFFFTYFVCLKSHNHFFAWVFLCVKAILLPFEQFKFQPSNRYEPIVNETDPILLIMWSISIILALFICVKAFLDLILQKINEVKISKMLLFIPILLNIFVLSLFVCIFGDFFKIDFIKKISFFSLVEKFEIRNATFGFFYFSIFCMIFIFEYLNKNIPPSGTNQEPADDATYEIKPIYHQLPSASTILNKVN